MNDELLERARGRECLSGDDDCDCAACDADALAERVRELEGNLRDARTARKMARNRVEDLEKSRREALQERDELRAEVER